MRGARHPTLCLLTAVLAFGGALYLASGVAHAQTFGRIAFVIVDEDGNLLPDVTVVATCDELTRFREEKTTNKKGRATVSVTDGTKVYNFHIEHPDYRPMDLQVKPELGKTTMRKITLSKEAASTATAPPGEEPRERLYRPAERVFNEGVEAVRTNDYAIAKAHFLEAVKLDAKMEIAHLALARLYFEEKDFTDALASADRVLELAPANTEALRVRYDAHRGLGHDAEAEAALEALKELAPGGATVAMVYNEGVAAMKRGDLQAAKARFLETLELDPDLADAAGALAVVYIREKSYAEAAAMAEKHLAAVPEDVRSLTIRWEAYKELGDAAQAEAAKQALVAADPTALVNDIFANAIAVFENGDTQAAVEGFEQVLELKPGHARAHYRLGLSKLNMGEMESAKMHLKKFLELAVPDDPEAATAKEMLSFL